MCSLTSRCLSIPVLRTNYTLLAIPLRMIAVMAADGVLFGSLDSIKQPKIPSPGVHASKVRLRLYLLLPWPRIISIAGLCRCSVSA